MKRLIIVDVSGFVFRAFYAIRPLHAPDGTPVNALYGVLNMLLKLISDYQPTHLFIAKDTAEETFRSEVYDEYKANRTEPPEDLIPQFDLIEEMIGHMKMPQLAKPGYEADDIIGSAAIQWRDKFDDIMIASGDKDLMQLVGGNITMVDTMKGVVYDRDKVKEKMGVWPEQVVDYLSMVGDSSDNIPGMRGIGAKGAAKLLEEHGSLDNCIKRKESFKGKKLTTAFSEYLDDALMSKELVSIVTDLKLDINPLSLSYKFDPSDSLMDFLGKLNFKTPIAKLREMQQIDSANSSATKSAKEEVDEGSFVDLDQEDHEVKDSGSKIVSNVSVKDLVKRIDDASSLALEIFYNPDVPHQREASAMSLSFDGEESFYLNDLGKGQEKKILEATYGRESVEIYSSNVKRDLEYLIQCKIPCQAKYFDVTQAHFVVDAGARHDLESMASSYLQTDLSEDGAHAGAVFKLADILKKKLEEHDLSSVYYEIDGPMISVLARMEMDGVNINKEYFEEMDVIISKKLAAIEKKIAGFCDGEEINLNSPKQVGELLFERLGLPALKKIKTGYSTDAGVLESLAAKNISPVPKLLLQYRELGKILSTYVKPLPEMINEVSGRIHTNFNQHVAVTGRLSSTNPNLQNIPIRTEMGREVRKGFIPQPGLIFLGVDYSQVELRLLAHFSGDSVMVESFKKGIDIHRQTAAEVLGASADKISIEERAVAKTVNFGLMYGQSSFGLANQLRISRKEAKGYITRYFERFFRVKDYMDSLKALCEKNGYSETLMKRKRFLPDIRSQNRTIKAAAERIAVNSPIQGTAADIIKLAMIKVQKEIEQRELSSKMVLQVHDELIFEVPESELDEMRSLVVEAMENVVTLKVPLTVDVNVGVKWFDLK